MTRPTPRELRRWLRRIDADSLARFVAALWAASGWSTSVQDGQVVARRHEPRTERRDLAVVAGHVAVARTLARVPDDADALVTPVDEREARLLSARTDLTVFGAGELHERLTYGVDAVAREHLIAEHLSDGERLVPRRSVLSTVAVGAGVFAGGALAPATPSQPEFEGSMWHDLGGPGPSAPGLGEPDDEYAPVDALDEDHTSTPTPPTACESDPRRALAAQIATFRREVAVHNDIVVEGERPVGYDPGDGTESLVVALQELGYEPFREARDVALGEPRETTARTVVPVTVRTDVGDRVTYEFTMTQTAGGCWLTDEAELVDQAEGD
jgi:hypothetical protein